MPPSFPNSDIKLVSPVGLSLLFGAALISYITYIICCAIYNLFFHQLREFPGPKAWIAFPILRHIANIRGVLDKRLRELHEIHGDVVRFSDKELSFITAQSWKDIYAYGNGHKQLRKEIFRDLGQPSSIINADDADHARYRKTLSHAFSEKGLREQEPLIKIYIDLLIEKLHDVAASGEKTDMVKWYNLTTFDLIGDLAFGEPFDGLKNSELHFWVKMLFQGIKMISFHRMAAEYPLVDSLFKLLLPKSLIQSREKHRDYTAKTVMKRITNRAAHGRGDFMDSMLRHRGTKDGLTDDEIVSQARVLIIAGSETTATLLSGVTYLLLKNPEALKKVAAEVRAAFEHEDEINFFNTTARLPYMLACLQECFRLYPPVPSGLQRYAQPGVPTQVSGYQVPPGVSVDFLFTPEASVELVLTQSPSRHS